MKTQQSGHVPRSGPEVKNGGSSAKDDVPERLGCGTVKKVSQILQRVSAALQEELSFRIILHILNKLMQRTDVLTKFVKFAT